MNEKVTFGDRWKALFAKNKYDFWFDHFSNEQKKLLGMDSFELAEVIAKKKEGKEGIFAAHILQSRLVNQQNRSVHIGTFFGLLGVVLGAFLGAYFSNPH